MVIPLRLPVDDCVDGLAPIGSTAVSIEPFDDAVPFGETCRRALGGSIDL